MLTKTDLNQIRGVVHEEVDGVVEKKLKPIKKDLRYLKKTVDIIDFTFFFRYGSQARAFDQK